MLHFKFAPQLIYVYMDMCEFYMELTYDDIMNF